MAKNITLLGASYTGVPAVTLPQTGGGIATFTDVSDTTATAADVASGKYFYAADGTLTQGTSSGGGGVEVTETPDSHGGTIVTITGTAVKPVQMGVLRPDAELVEKWTMDQYAVADLGLTIPAYSTANATLKTGATLATLTGDPLKYRYFITERMLTIPEYSITTLAKGREEYTMGFAQYEWLYNPAGQQQTIINPSKAYGVYSQMQAATLGREVYWSSATAVGVYTSSAYGANQVFVAPTIASNKTLTIKSPQIAIRGHTSYLTSTFFNAITDIRCQYVIELWRVPLTGIDGWVIGTQMDSVLDDIKNNGGTLT